jgi:hypothetical protein
MADRVARRISLATFQNRAFQLAAGLYALHLGLEKSGFSVLLLKYYLNDLLCMPLVLTLTLFLQRTFTFRNPSHVFTKYQVGLAVLYYSLGFEVILPLFMSRYTADPLDVLAYALGGWYFYFYINVTPGPRPV